MVHSRVKGGEQVSTVHNLRGSHMGLGELCPVGYFRVKGAEQVPIAQSFRGSHIATGGPVFECTGNVQFTATVTVTSILQ